MTQTRFQPNSHAWADLIACLLKNGKWWLFVYDSWQWISLWLRVAAQCGQCSPQSSNHGQLWSQTWLLGWMCTTSFLGSCAFCITSGWGEILGIEGLPPQSHFPVDLSIQSWKVYTFCNIREFPFLFYVWALHCQITRRVKVVSTVMRAYTRMRAVMAVVVSWLELTSVPLADELARKQISLVPWARNRSPTHWSTHT